nr:protein phosphatase 1 regulatory subunit 1C isoform X1 [Anser cygnoides]
MKIHLLSAGSLIPDKADSSKCHTSQDLPCFLSFQLFVMVTRRLTQCSLAVGLELCLQHSPLTCLQHCLSRDAALASRTPLLQELCCAALQWSGALSKRIRKRRPTPASLVIMNEHVPPEKDEKRTNISQAESQSASPKQRKQSVYTPPALKGIKHLKSQSDSAFPEEEEGISEREEEWDH